MAGVAWQRAFDRGLNLCTRLPLTLAYFGLLVHVIVTTIKINIDKRRFVHLCSSDTDTSFAKAKALVLEDEHDLHRISYRRFCDSNYHGEIPWQEIGHETNMESDTKQAFHLICTESWTWPETVLLPFLRLLKFERCRWRKKLGRNNVEIRKKLRCFQHLHTRATSDSDAPSCKCSFY